MMTSHIKRSLRQQAGATWPLLVAALWLWSPSYCSAAKPPANDDLKLTPANQRKADALAHYSRGLAAEQQGNYEQALEHYRKVVELDPEAVAVHNQIVALLMRNRDVTGVIAHLEKAVRKNPKSFDLLFQLGEAYKAARQLDKAISSYKEAIKADPLGLIAYQHLAAAYLDQKRFADAVQVLDMAGKQNSNQGSYWLRLGESYTSLMQQNPAAAQEHKVLLKAVAAFEKARSLSPGDLDVHSKLVSAYWGIGQKEKAIAELDKLIAAQPGHWRLYYLKGQLFDDIKQHDSAAEMYIKALTLKHDELAVQARLVFTYRDVSQKEKVLAELDKLIAAQPGNWQLYRLKAELHDIAKQYDAAVELYRKCISLSPESLDLYLALAFAQMRQKKPSDALATLTEAQEKFPRNPRVAYFFALIHSEAKDYDKALKAFELAEHLAKTEAKVDMDDRFYFHYGAAYERSGNIEKAAEMFKKALKIEPNNADALNYLGYMWAEKGINLDEAYDLIKKALELDPDNGAYIDSLGWVYYQKGNYQEALTWLLKAADKLKEPDATVFDHIGDAFEKLGKLQDAITYWKKAIELEPQNEQIKSKLEKALERAGERKP